MAKRAALFGTEEFLSEAPAYVDRVVKDYGDGAVDLRVVYKKFPYIVFVGPHGHIGPVRSGYTLRTIEPRERAYSLVVAAAIARAHNRMY